MSWQTPLSSCSEGKEVERSQSEREDNRSVKRGSGFQERGPKGN